MSHPIVFSVMTATWNRAETLPRLHRSLLEQTCRDFEWIVVDDGSTDSTPDLVRRWRQDATFPIEYLAQERRGKHVAINSAVQAARGEFFLILDSDDWLFPTSLERYLSTWQSIPAGEQGRFAGVAGRCAAADGSLIGDAWPRDLIDADPVDIRRTWGITGDLAEMVRTAVMREFPLPVFGGETFLSEGVLWCPMARRYRFRYVNEPLYRVEYRSDGLSARVRDLLLMNPRGAYANSREWIASVTRPGIFEGIRAYARLIRYGWHAGSSTNEVLRTAPSRLWCLAALPVAQATYLRDRARLRDLSRRGEGPLKKS